MGGMRREAVGATVWNVYLSYRLVAQSAANRCSRRRIAVLMVALSVLDLSPVTTATPPSAALNNSLDLARLLFSAADGGVAVVTGERSRTERATIRTAIRRREHRFAADCATNR